MNFIKSFELLRGAKTLLRQAAMRFSVTSDSKINHDNSTIELRTGSGPVKVHNYWLRDNCFCSQCFNSATSQRYTDLLRIPMDVKVDKLSVGERGNFRISWSDGHESDYQMSWILGALGLPGGSRSNLFYSESHKRELWGGKDLEARGGLPTVPMANLDEGGDVDVIKNLLRFGVSAISGVPANPEASKSVCSRISLPQRNVYGDFWVVNPMDQSADQHADTAYTNEALSAHTDGTYSRNTPGVQAFHILDVPPGGGGKTLLVDGFHVAERLREEDKPAFDFLSSNPIHHHSIDSRYHLRSFEPVIKTAASGELEQIRFNPYDRSPLTHFSHNETTEFYRSYRKLVELMRDPSSEFWVQLDTTSLLLTYNWRVLHGRSSFVGKRSLAGCYLSRDEFISKARRLGVL